MSDYLKFDEICLSVGYTFYKNNNERIVNPTYAKKSFGNPVNNKYHIYSLFPTYDENYLHDHTIDGSHDIQFFMSANGSNYGVNLVMTGLLKVDQINSLCDENKKLPVNSEIKYKMTAYYFYTNEEYDLDIVFIKTKFNNLCVKSMQIKLNKEYCDKWATRFYNMLRQFAKSVI